MMVSMNWRSDTISTSSHLIGSSGIISGSCITGTSSVTTSSFLVRFTRAVCILNPAAIYLSQEVYTCVWFCLKSSFICPVVILGSRVFNIDTSHTTWGVAILVPLSCLY